MIEGVSSRELVAAAERAVAAGELRPGAALPSVRALATANRISPSTAAAAYAELKRRGVIVARPRSGYRIAGRPPLTAPAGAAVPEGVRDLATGNPDPALLPDLRRALKGLDTRPRLYGEPAILPDLAERLRGWLAADGIDAARLCVTNGALDGVERVLGAHLATGDRVAVEDPGYGGLLDLARAMGLDPVGVELDEVGMRPEALRAAVRHGARAVLVTPRGQNPTGAALSARRARELARVLPPDVLVVEDDHLGPVAGVPYRTLTAGRPRWAAVRSVSKWLGPDLRLAALAGDPTTVSRVEGRQAVGPGWVSTLIQQLVGGLLADPETETLAEQAATLYAGRRRSLLDALAQQGVAARAASGLNVWVPVADEDAAVRSLLAAGYAVGSGSRHRIAAAPGIRITAASLSPREAPAVAEAVAAALGGAGRTRAA